MGAADDDGNAEQLKEPIFVCFAPDEKVGQEVFRSMLEYMDTWSKENKDANNCSELLNAILIVKGTSTQIFKKVSKLQSRNLCFVLI